VIYYPTFMARYSLFVLKVPLNPKQTNKQLKGSMKESNVFHKNETEKITRKANDMAQYIELFGSSTQDRHARCI